MLNPPVPDVASVLYAEDEDLIGNTLTEVLRDNGYDVHRVSDGLEALAAAEVRRFDILLTDLDMPRMDGGELIRSMRTTRPDLPVVILTGNPPSGGASSFEDPGCGPTLLLGKPARLAIIVATLEAVRVASAKADATRPREQEAKAGDDAGPRPPLLGFMRRLTKV